MSYHVTTDCLIRSRDDLLQHVANDYARRLAEGQTECEKVITAGLKQRAVYTGKLEPCRLLNESYCEVTRDGNRSLTVVVYNARLLTIF